MVSASIQSLVDRITGNLSGDQVDLVLDRYRGILEDVKSMELEFQVRLQIELGSELGKAISTASGDAGADVLYSLIKGMGIHSKTVLGDHHVVPDGLVIPISLAALDNSDLLAALWLSSRIAGRKSCVRSHLNIDEKMGKVARSSSDQRDAVRRALGLLASYPPAADLGRMFDIGGIAPTLMLDGNDFIARAAQAGGIPYLAKKGYPLDFVHQTIMGNADRGISFKTSHFLLALMDFQHDAGELSEIARNDRAVALLKVILAELNNRDGSKLNGWKALVTKLLPFAPSDLSAKEFIALGRMMPVEKNPAWDKPLSETLSRNEFRAKVRKTVSNQIQFDVVRNLRLESFYTLPELYQMGGMRSILSEAMENLDQSPENDNPALRKVLSAAMAIYQARDADNYQAALLSFLPFVSRKLSEMPLICMAQLVLLGHGGSPGREEGGVVAANLAIRWPENLEKRVNHVQFELAMNMLVAPEHRFQVVNMLRLECIYTRQQLFKLKGERLSADLGL